MISGFPKFCAAALLGAILAAWPATAKPKACHACPCQVKTRLCIRECGSKKVCPMQCTERCNMKVNNHYAPMCPYKSDQEKPKA